ncbi:MAG: LLM class flavin-dependent oxidoreductase [Candidatus Limnocylindrales bacterium]
MNDSAPAALRISIRLPHSRCLASVDAVLAVAAAAERLGFWGVSAEDHVLADPRTCPEAEPSQGRTFLEPLQLLALLAGRTERVRLITGVLQLPYRHPVLLAKETMTLDTISHGRLVLGVGVGALRGRRTAEGVDLVSNASIAAREYDAFGITGHRGRMTDEYIDALKAIWTDERASFHGTYVAFDGIDMYPRPVQLPRPPIWIGGRSEAAHRRVAFQADGWYPSQTSADMLAEGRRRIEALSVEAGREVGDFGPCNEFYIRSDDAEARATMRRYYRFHFTSDEAMFAQTFAGSPARIVEQLGRLREAGATFVDLRPLGVSLANVLEQLEILAAEVVPALAGVMTSAEAAAPEATATEA